jgi:hypothetical protein
MSKIVPPVSRGTTVCWVQPYQTRVACTCHYPNSIATLTLWAKGCGQSDKSVISVDTPQNSPWSLQLLGVGTVMVVVTSNKISVWLITEGVCNPSPYYLPASGMSYLQFSCYPSSGYSLTVLTHFENNQCGGDHSAAFLLKPACTSMARCFNFRLALYIVPR